MKLPDDIINYVFVVLHKTTPIYLLTFIQNMDTTAINAPKNTAQAMASTAISREPIEPSADDAELSVDGELVFEEEADDPDLMSDGDISVCAPALTSRRPCRDNFDFADGSFVIRALSQK